MEIEFEMYPDVKVSLLNRFVQGAPVVGWEHTDAISLELRA